MGEPGCAGEVVNGVLEWLEARRKQLITVVFWATVLALLWGKLTVLWSIDTHLESIDQRLEEQANKDAAIDYGYRSALCKQLGVRNDECEYFPSGVTIMLVAPEGAAMLEGP